MRHRAIKVGLERVGIIVAWSIIFNGREIWEPAQMIDIVAKRSGNEYKIINT